MADIEEVIKVFYLSIEHSSGEDGYVEVTAEITRKKGSEQHWVNYSHVGRPRGAQGPHFPDSLNGGGTLEEAEAHIEVYATRLEGYEVIVPRETSSSSK